jgi:hypothetical protein
MVGEYNNTTMSLKVLTFNVCSDACLLKQTGKPRNGIGTGLATICQDEGCIENVADSIDSGGPWDIVALQEATNHEGIKAVSKQLKSMNHVSGVAEKK